jgi:3-oxoadipyl-CoA thiolase
MLRSSRKPKPSDPVIVAAVRTPIGRYAGVLKDVRPDDLGAVVLAEVVRRANVAPEEVEDVFMGCTNQAGEDNRNVARMSLLLAGYPVSVPAMTVNRLCGSGLQAVNNAAHAIWAEQGSIFVAGGVESMTRAPFVLAKSADAFMRGPLKLEDSTIGWRFINSKLAALYHPYSMGETAENVAEKWKVSREAQDAFALESQRRTAAAQAAGRFKEEIVGVAVPANRKGETTLVEVDEHPRPDTTLEKLARLKSPFKAGGSVTAGNSSGINDGAAALVVMSYQQAQEKGLQSLARIISTATAGVDPAYMGMGPVPASRKALERASMTVKDLDLVELNEAFASQSLACIRDLELDPTKVNVNGGAIALGHPLGASGARLLTTLVYELRRRGGGYGLATMCIGVGQGIATVVEVLEGSL